MPLLVGQGLRPADVGNHLRRFCSAPHYHTWPDAVSLLDPSLFAPQFIAGPQQITDIYLLGLATRMGGQLATFDRTIPLLAVHGATVESLQIIGRSR